MMLAWILVAVATVVLCLDITVGPRGRRRERDLFTFTESVDLPATAEIVTSIDRRIRDRSVGQSLGGLAAVLGFALVLLLSPGSVPLGIAGLATIGLFAAAIAIGGGVSALRQFPAPRGQGASRVARLDAPTLTDYVHWAWIWTSTIASTAAISCVVWLFNAAPAGGVVGGVFPVEGIVALASVSIAGVAFAAILSRHLLEIPQFASDGRELQWDDALRAYALRDVWIASIALSTASVVTTLAAAFSATSPALYVAILIGVSPAFLSPLRASRRSSVRLWHNAGTEC